VGVVVLVLKELVAWRQRVQLARSAGKPD